MTIHYQIIRKLLGIVLRSLLRNQHLAIDTRKIILPIHVIAVMQTDGRPYDSSFPTVPYPTPGSR